MKPTKKNRLLPAVLLLLAAVPAGLYAFGFFLLRPFVAQTPQDVEMAYLLRTWNPLLSLAVLVVVVAAAAWAWRGSSWLGRGGLVLALGLSAMVAWGSRVNHFEDLFNPLAENRFASASELDFLAAEDMVMGVTVGGESRAWPVGILAYHHIVNDEVGGVPLVATY